MEELPQVGETGHPTYELRIYDHVPYINPKDYTLDCRGIDPKRYFITSGDAVEKTKVLDKDMWALAGELRKLCKETPKNKKLKKYESEIWKNAGKTRKLLQALITSRGSAIFMEIENDIYSRCITIPKNPRARGDVVE